MGNLSGTAGSFSRDQGPAIFPYRDSEGGNRVDYRPGERVPHGSSRGRLSSRLWRLVDNP